MIFPVIQKSVDLGLDSKSLHRVVKFNILSVQKDHQKMSAKDILLAIFKHIFSWCH